MINLIIDAFRNQAREHKTILSFMYNRNYEKGSGNDVYPLFWLEDPITGRNRDNLFTNTVNFSILFIPENIRSISELQSLAFSIGLNIIERIKKDKTLGISIQPDWSFITLRDYYDDNACGCRFTVNFNQLNMQNLCLIDEQFDPDKQFETKNPLKDITVNPSNNCEIFINKLPDFDIKTNRR